MPQMRARVACLLFGLLMTCNATAQPNIGQFDQRLPDLQICQKRLQSASEALGTNRADQATSLLEPCLPRARRGFTAAWKIELRLILSMASLGQGDNRRGLQLAQEAATETRALDDPRLRIKAFNAVGDMHFYLFEMAAARQAYEQARITFDQAQIDPHSPDGSLTRALILKNIGIAEYNLGWSDRALRYLEEAKDLLQPGRHLEYHISILGNLGSVYAHLGAPKLALAAYRQALVHVTERQTPDERVDILLRIGELYLEADLPRLAVDTLVQAQALAKKYSPVPNRVWLGSLLATAYRAAGQPDAAQNLLVDNLVLRRQAGNSRYLAADLIELGSLRGWQRPEEAKHLFLEAFEAAQDTDPMMTAQALAQLAKLHLQRGDTDRAIYYSEAALLAFGKASIRNETAAPPVPERSIHQTAVDAFLHRGEGDDVRRAFEIAEQDQSQRSPHFAAVETPQAASIEQVRALLGDGKALLTYFPLADDIAVFVVDSQQLQVTRLAISPSLMEERVDNYLELLGLASGEGWRAVSRHLYRELFAPLRELLSPEVESLILVLGQELMRLPFESLLDEQASDERFPVERFLVEDFDLSYIPSATLLQTLQRRGEPPESADSTRSLVIGPPTISPASSRAPEASRHAWHTYVLAGQTIVPIPGATEEAQLVARHGGELAELLLGARATETAFKNLPLERFGLLHFATHGILSSHTPSRSALLLTGDERQDGFLQAREIKHLPLTADLVVLSACQTLERPNEQTAGAQGIASSFFQAGAASVVASLWAVSDRGTTPFMDSFYHYLAAGHSKVRALRQAKLDAIGQGQPPSVWAAFVLIGEDDRPLSLTRSSLINSPRRSIGIWILLALVLVSLSRWVLQKRTRL